jgi:serine/threonine protein kinase
MSTSDSTDPPSSTGNMGGSTGGVPVVPGTDPLGSGSPAEVRPKSEKPPASVRPGGATSLLGTIISGRYRIERLLGEGGMGAVYQAEHTHMRKRLAVKVLHPEMSRLPEVVARFEREAMAAAHIDHPNVATATDFGKLEDGSFFLVLEFVEGKSLRESIARGPLEVGRAMRILRQAAAALVRAHALGIVHRDLKPENVMLVDRDGEPDFVKVLDFGIAKVPVGELSRDEHNKAGPAGTALTQLGMVYGTPEYMAPEQALGQNVTPSADIYALGVMMFEMLAGVRPYDHESKVTLLGMHVTAPIPAIAQKAPSVVVPPPVEAVIVRMLAKESGERFKDAKELIDALDGVWVAAYGNPPGQSPQSTANPRGSMVSAAELGRSSPMVMGNSADASAPVSLAGPAAAGEGRAPWPSESSLSTRLAAIRGNPLVQRALTEIKANPKPFLFAGLGVTALFGLILLVTLVVGAGKKTGQTTDDAGTVVEGAPSGSGEEMTVEPAVDRDMDAKVAAAIELVEKKGDFGSGIDKLTQLEKDAPHRADIHRALQKAYAATKNTKESMREAELWLDADASAINDLKLDEDVRNAAIGREAQDAAFGLLEKKMDAAGPDILYDIAHGQSGAQYPSAAERARRSLNKPDVRKLASPSLLVTLDLRGADSCDAKKNQFQRARESGDARTLVVLRSYSATRGCGFARSRDCWPCMRANGALSKTISDLEARVKTP